MPDAGLAFRRWLFLLLTLSSTAATVTKLWSVLQSGGLSPGEAFFLILFAILFGWISAAFWLALFGVVARLEDVKLAAAGRGAARRSALTHRHPDAGL